MDHPHRSIKIGILNGDNDLGFLFQELLQEHGYSVSAENLKILSRLHQIPEYLKKVDPKIILWDVPYPYRDAFSEFSHIRQSDPDKDREYVLTTCGKESVEKLLKEYGISAPVFGTPFDIDDFDKMIHAEVRKVQEKEKQKPEGNFQSKER